VEREGKTVGAYFCEEGKEGGKGGPPSRGRKKGGDPFPATTSRKRKKIGLDEILKRNFARKSLPKNGEKKERNSPTEGAKRGERSTPLGRIVSVHEDGAEGGKESSPLIWREGGRKIRRRASDGGEEEHRGEKRREAIFPVSSLCLRG